MSAQKKPKTGSAIIQPIPGYHNTLRRMERFLRIEEKKRPKNVVGAYNKRPDEERAVGTPFKKNGEEFLNVRRLHPTKGYRIESISRS